MCRYEIFALASSLGLAIPRRLRWSTVQPRIRYHFASLIALPTCTTTGTVLPDKTGLLRGPILGAVVLTLLLATYFLVAGVFRIVAAAVLHLPNRGWVLFNGIVTLALGIITWGGWPASSFWVIGLYLGITLILSGFARIMLALALRTGHFQALPI